jgi:uncharacterized glyoxalase superfamily protein PhnB
MSTAAGARPSRSARSWPTTPVTASAACRPRCTHDTDYGSRDFAAQDPEGNRWSFGTYRGEPRKG